MQCPTCRSEDCVQIEINLTVGNSVEFYSCRACEAKWWVRDGDSVALDDVLDLAGRRA